MLREMEKAKPSGSNQYKKQDALHDERHPPVLKELNISYTQSHRWQQLAAIPKDQKKIDNDNL